MALLYHYYYRAMDDPTPAQIGIELQSYRFILRLLKMVSTLSGFPAQSQSRWEFYEGVVPDSDSLPPFQNLIASCLCTSDAQIVRVY